ncbi:MAG: alpha/beta hydrolase [Bacteroidota bacterium]
MQKIKRPSIFLFLTETIRAIWEYFKCRSFLKKFTAEEKGDGHTVLVIPGFMASDTSTKPLRQLLEKSGYRTAGWHLGTNFADLTQLDIIGKQIDQLYQESGQPISLIGWSLGGVYARELARERTDKIRQIITLGSPFAGINEPNNATITFNIIKRLRNYPELDENFIAQLPEPVPVPTTAIYSKEDGIVPWQACMEQKEDDLHQNVEVKGSHLGLGVNIDVLKIILERLPYRKRNWVKRGEQRLFIGSI